MLPSRKYTRGKPVRESTGETSIKKAKAKLDQRLAEVRTGKYLGSEEARVTVNELAEGCLRDLIQGNKDIINPKIGWEKHLKPVLVFGRRCHEDDDRQVVLWKA